MSRVVQSDVRNRLLLSLSAEDFKAIAPYLERVELPQGLMIAERNSWVGHVVFPDSGIGSIIVASPKGVEIEAGLFGREGLGPLSIVLGADRVPTHIVVQAAGSGHRIAASTLTRLMDTNSALRRLLLLYVQTFVTQAVFTALSNAISTVEERLARWLLMCHDRCLGDEIRVTHHSIAMTLAVRRASATQALHVLEYKSFIKAERGVVFIRDRKGLEHLAGESYGRPEAEYRRLLGSIS